MCTVAFSKNATGVLASSNQIVGIFDDCYANSSLFVVVANANLLNSSSTNFSKLASEQINSLNFSSAGTFDIGSVLNLADSPTDQLSSLQSVDLTAVNVTSLNWIITSGVPDLMTGIIALNSSLAIINTNAAITLANGADSVQANIDFHNAMSVIFNLINSLANQSGQLYTINLTSTNLVTNIIAVNQTAGYTIVRNNVKLGCL